MSEPILQVEDLHVEFWSRHAAVQAVRGASFTLARGRVLGLVGESGSGKSVSLRAILGLVPYPGRITGGRIIYDGVDLLLLSPRRLRRIRGSEISIVFQEPMTALNPLAHVGDQIAEAPHSRLGYSGKRARARALELMHLVGIPDPLRRFHAYPHQLSGGLRQRVMIAIALSAQPKLILCDEPTTALDVTIQDQILKLLLRLQKQENLSVLFVTHDLAVVAQMCDDIAVMYGGRVLETGRVESVFREPRHSYTLGLLRSVPDFGRVRDRLESISGSPPDPASPLPGCPFQPRCRFAQPDCVDGDFPLHPLGDGHKTACIHSDRVVASVAENPVLVDA